jgi:hypothetical protein
MCHVNQDNPTDFRTITVPGHAICEHLAHGDLWGNCMGYCTMLCNDGNACTDDNCDPATQKCVPPSARPAVSCDDGSLCTADSCDPAIGCVHTQTLTCDPGNVCDPNLGTCAPRTCDSTVDGEFPWYVSLQIGSKVCGGTLLSPTAILTAASCVYGAAQDGVLATVGGASYNSASHTEHAAYDPNQTPAPNNIAIVKLAGSVPIGFDVAVATLPADNTENFAWFTSLSSGYANCGAPSALLPGKAWATVLPTSECNNKLGGGVTDLNLCVYDYGGQGVCAIQEGAPIMSPGWSGTLVTGVEGPCGGAVGDKPLVTARTSAYISWIQNNM